MDTRSSEQALRRDASRRRLQGERRSDICHGLRRGTTWFHKGWAEYRHHPTTDFADRSRAPPTAPQQTPAPVEQAVRQLRQAREGGPTAETRYGLIGPRALRTALARLGSGPLPSWATLPRSLARRGVTQPRGASAATASDPELRAWAPHALHAPASLPRPLDGGPVVQNRHTFDHDTPAVSRSQHPDTTSATVRAPLLKTWAHWGLPALQHSDHEAAFRGGPPQPRALGQGIRLCLLVGVAVVSIPEYEANRNHWVEGFHALWVQAVWSRSRFRPLAAVPAEAPTFLRWYQTRYRPPRLAGQTPAQMRRGAPGVRWPVSLHRLIPHHLPLTHGRLHFLRKVEGQGHVPVLNEPRVVGRTWRGEDVRVGVDTAQQTLTIWPQPEAPAPWRHLQTSPSRS